MSTDTFEKELLESAFFVVLSSSDEAVVIPLRKGLEGILATHAQMGIEGASSVQDLNDYNKDMLDSLEDCLRKPGQGVPPFVFSPVHNNRLPQASQFLHRCWQTRYCGLHQLWCY